MKNEKQWLIDNDDFNPPSALLRPDDEVLTTSELTDTVLSDTEKGE